VFIGVLEEWGDQLVKADSLADVFLRRSDVIDIDFIQVGSDSVILDGFIKVSTSEIGANTGGFECSAVDGKSLATEGETVRSPLTVRVREDFREECSEEWIQFELLADEMELLTRIYVSVLEDEELAVSVLKSLPNRISYRADRGLVPPTRVGDRTTPVRTVVLQELTEWPMNLAVHLIEAEHELTEEIERAETPLAEFRECLWTERDLVVREIILWLRKC
jgi:hypothetical protein